MKTKEALEKYRIQLPSFMKVEDYSEKDDYGYYSTGAFRFGDILVIVSHSEEEGGWHLSMSKKKSLPTYEEIKDMRYKLLPNRIYACEIFPPRTEFVNLHEFCRHLWEMPTDEKKREEFV